MKLKNALTIFVLIMLLSFGLVAASFFRWLETQPEEVDVISLTNQINERRNKLSTVVCSADIIQELQVLFEDQERFIEQFDVNERVDYYFDLALTQAKIAYIYEIEGNREESEKHYSTAAVYIDIGTENVDGSAFVRRIARDSSAGCIAR